MTGFSLSLNVTLEAVFSLFRGLYGITLARTELISFMFIRVDCGRFQVRMTADILPALVLPLETDRTVTD